MNKTIYLLLLILVQQLFSFADLSYPKVPEKYYFVRENLIFYKEDNLKIYFGGPISRSNEHGVRWVMPIVFENSDFKPRSVYEISFVNCDPETAQDATIRFLDASDIDIKMKNILNDQYKIFSEAINGSDGKKQIIVRFADISMIIYPDIFISDKYHDQFIENDKEQIVAFLYKKLHVKKEFDS